MTFPKYLFLGPFALFALNCGHDEGTASVEKALTPATVTVEVHPRIEGIAIYAGYYGPGLPMIDPGYKYVTGISKATGFTFTVPGSAVCENGFTTAKALDGQPIPAGIVPKGIEMKFAMPNGWSAGVPGQTPGDNEVAKIVVNGTELGPLPIMTYNGSDNRNLYISSWLLGCTP